MPSIPRSYELRGLAGRKEGKKNSIKYFVLRIIHFSLRPEKYMEADNRFLFYSYLMIVDPFEEFGARVWLIHLSDEQV